MTQKSGTHTNCVKSYEVPANFHNFAGANWVYARSFPKVSVILVALHKSHVLSEDALNRLHRVGGKLAYVARNMSCSVTFLFGNFPDFFLWLLPSVHQSFEGCCGTYNPWDNPKVTDLTCSNFLMCGISRTTCATTKIERLRWRVVAAAMRDYRIHITPLPGWERLGPLYVYLWGHLNNNIYQTPFRRLVNREEITAKLGKSPKRNVLAKLIISCNMCKFVANAQSLLGAYPGKNIHMWRSNKITQILGSDRTDWNWHSEKFWSCWSSAGYDILFMGSVLIGSPCTFSYSAHEKD